MDGRRTTGASCNLDFPSLFCSAKCSQMPPPGSLETLSGYSPDSRASVVFRWIRDRETSSHQILVRLATGDRKERRRIRDSSGNYARLLEPRLPLPIIPRTPLHTLETPPPPPCIPSFHPASSSSVHPGGIRYLPGFSAASPCISPALLTWENPVHPYPSIAFPSLPPNPRPVSSCTVLCCLEPSKYMYPTSSSGRPHPNRRRLPNLISNIIITRVVASRRPLPPGHQDLPVKSQPGTLQPDHIPLSPPPPPPPFQPLKIQLHAHMSYHLTPSEAHSTSKQ